MAENEKIRYEKNATNLNASAAALGTNLARLVHGRTPNDWQWKDWPLDVIDKAETEEDYYPWLEWVVFRPAAHAVSAVRDSLYNEAGVEVPPLSRGYSTTRSIRKSTPRGTTDILH